MAEKEYIERGVLIEEMDSDAPENWTNSDTEIQEEWDYHRYRDIILAQPIADVVEVRHGEWIRELIRNEKGGCVGANMICSCCEQPSRHDEFMKYCPNCGAQMKGTIKNDL
jgi:rubrerythrin